MRNARRGKHRVGLPVGTNQSYGVRTVFVLRRAVSRLRNRRRRVNIRARQPDGVRRNQSFPDYRRRGLSFVRLRQHAPADCQ